MQLCQGCYDRERRLGDNPVVQAPPTPVRRTSSAPLTPLSPQQQTLLRDAVKSDGSGKQGRTAAAKEHAVALRVLDAMRQAAPDRSVDVLVKAAAAATVMSPVKLRAVHRHFEKTEELTPPKKPRMTRADPLHPLFMEGGPTLVVEQLLHKKLKEAAERNTYQSVMTLSAEVFAVTGEEIPRSTMHSWMRKLGYDFGEKKLSGLTASYSAALIRRYIFDYSAMLQLEASGEYVLVWMDESYIHTGYCSSYSWFHPQMAGNTTVVQNRVRGSEKGKRLIIMHAMTRDGMLEDPQAEPTDDLSQVHASAAIVSVQLSAEGGDPEDYHKTLNGDKFVAWLRNRLLPAFEKCYNTHEEAEKAQGAARTRATKKKQKKKMILILDNASYHHPHGEDWYTSSDMKKPALGKFLRDVAGVSSIADPNSGRVFAKEKLTADARGDGGGPTVKLMRSVVSDYLKSHPGVNTTVVQQLMSDRQHRLLYTPPYESWLQPIELAWAQVKHQVARQSVLGRTNGDTAEQTAAALKGMDKQRCNKIIEHTHKLMNEWLQSDDAGSLRPFGSLAALMAANSRQRAQCADLSVEEARLIEEKEAEKENQEGEEN